MSTRLAVSKSRPIRDTRRPLPTHKVAEAPLSHGSTRGRRTEGKRGRDGKRVGGHRGREGLGVSWRVVRDGWGKHHPSRIKDMCVGACSIRTAASGGFPSSYPSRTRRATPRYSIAQLFNAATTTRLRHDGRYTSCSHWDHFSRSYLHIRRAVFIITHAFIFTYKVTAGCWLNEFFARVPSIERNFEIWTNVPTKCDTRKLFCEKIQFDLIIWYQLPTVDHILV